MIWDGDCHFCKHWIERWEVMTAGAVDYAPSQSIASRYPEIDAETFSRAVVLVEPNGAVSIAAKAVCRSLSYAPRWAWTWRFYEQVPGFAAASETLYGIVARNRSFASLLTRWAWGEDVRPSTYFAARRWFLRLLGITYFIAFLSLFLQIDGLVGERGILPAREFFLLAHQQLGASAYLALPSLCWIDASNTSLHLLCIFGMIASGALLIGITPIAALVVTFVGYLSLTIAGQTFFSFQWDILLLETGFLAIFIAPTHWLPRRGREQLIPRAGLFLLKLLLFKLILMSGIVKLTSGDDSWSNLTALDYHYWTQPLPTVFAWFADKSPEWVKHLSVGATIAAEIIVPFLIWAPRRIRFIAAILLVGLQATIALTGNYCFFNLLAAALCLLLIDDSWWPKRQRPNLVAMIASRGARIMRVTAIALLIITLPLNSWLIYSAFYPDARRPNLLAAASAPIESLRIANGYGLFRVMTKERPEIVVEGSGDGETWLPYEFKWKPGGIHRAPRWNAPHQPRLDWQMWFAALGGRRQEAWFYRFAEALLKNEPDVISLLGSNPFAQNPPRYVRALLCDYRFTTIAERNQTGDWWVRESRGEYMPAVSLNEN